MRREENKMFGICDFFGFGIECLRFPLEGIVVGGADFFYSLQFRIIFAL